MISIPILATKISFMCALGTALALTGAKVIALESDEVLSASTRYEAENRIRLARQEGGIIKTVRKSAKIDVSASSSKYIHLKEEQSIKVRSGVKARSITVSARGKEGELSLIVGDDDYEIELDSNVGWQRISVDVSVNIGDKLVIVNDEDEPVDIDYIEFNPKNTSQTEEINKARQPFSFVSILSNIKSHRDGITVDPRGDLNLGGFGSFAVVDSAGNVSLSTIADGSAPLGLGYSNEGELLGGAYFIDAIVKQQNDGSFLPMITGVGGPNDIVVDDSGNIYVAECGFAFDGYNVKKYAPNGELLALIPLKASGPSCVAGLARDIDGTIYASLWNDGAIYKIVDDQAFLLVNLSSPSGLIFNVNHFAVRHGTVYAPSVISNSIHRINEDGIVDIFSGTNAIRSVGGHISKADFVAPNGIAVSNNGEALYVQNRNGDISVIANYILPPAFSESGIGNASIPENTVDPADVACSDANKGNVFVDCFNAQWGTFHAFDTGLGGRTYTDGTSDNHIRWHVVDLQDNAHNRVIEVQSSYGNPLGLFEVTSQLDPNASADLTEFAGGQLSFDIRVLDYGFTTQGFVFKVDCYWPCSSGDIPVTGLQGGEWKTVSVLVDDMVAMGLDLSRVNRVFAFLPSWGDQSGTRAQLDNIIWRKAGEF